MKNDPQSLRPLFHLDPDIVFLNHGSYGACPKPVFKAYQQYQRDLETQPVRFMQEKVYELLERSREALGDYINCHKEDVIFVHNPTHAVANVIHNLDLQSGDEVLSTNLEYGSCDRMWVYDGAQRGYKYIQAEITLPVVDTDTFCKEFWNHASKNTRYIFISQITSSTGMILPI
ncbi:MAG: aminotransferase class V-fold PLP-dependent enzyme, partial [Candidatus Marinimicrobia bacterium]|nr:aminotransferase class V-fold PLP-dependent enzyme [Candidatus Neomarinimicrobiota bacterium]